MFFNKDWNIRIVVHGDDFTVPGFSSQLDWFRSKISERYEVKFDSDFESCGDLERVRNCV